MGGLYVRGKRLWFRLKGADGQWRGVSSGLSVGQEAAAREALRDMEERIKAGLQLPRRQREPEGVTVAAYAQRWLAERKARRLATAIDDEARLNTHILPLLGKLRLSEVRPRHIRDFIRALRTRQGRRGTIAPRTIRHLYYEVRSLFHDAVVDELIPSNPCALKKGDLPKKIDKDPLWRMTAIFSRDEVELILSDPRTPPDRRTMYALLFLGGMRFGEAAALRWRHYEPERRPLGRLLLAKSFSTRRHEEGSVKTEAPREVPVHPLLGLLLRAWRDAGWALVMGRAPQPDDLIIPSRLSGDRNRAVNLGLERFHEDLRRIGLRPRRQHDARRTFITLARQNGVNKDILRWVTHGVSTDVMDVYTTPSWESRCNTVLAIRVILLEEERLELRRRELRVTDRPGTSPSSGEALLDGDAAPPADPSQVMVRAKLEQLLQTWDTIPSTAELRRTLVGILHDVC